MHKQGDRGMTPVRRRRVPQPGTTAGGLHTTLLSVCRLMVHQAAKWTTEELQSHEADVAACELFSSPQREGQEEDE